MVAADPGPVGIQARMRAQRKGITVGEAGLLGGKRFGWPLDASRQRLTNWRIGLGIDLLQKFGFYHLLFARADNLRTSDEFYGVLGLRGPQSSQ